MDAEKIKQLREILRLLNRAGHLSGRQGRAFFELFDDYEALKAEKETNEKIRSTNPQKSAKGNDSTHKRASNRSGRGLKRQ